MVDNNGIERRHAVFDEFGKVQGIEYYDAAGDIIKGTQPWSHADAAQSPFLYTGRWFDRDTGLQNNTNRWYDPAIGRWLSEDPISFAASDANLYRYVGNGPTDWIDPRGLAAGTAWGAGRSNPYAPPLSTFVDQNGVTWQARWPIGPSTNSKQCSSIYAAPKVGSQGWNDEQNLMERQNYWDWYLGRKPTFPPPGAWSGVKQREAIQKCETEGSLNNVVDPIELEL